MHPRFVYDNPYIHVGSKAEEFMREEDIDPALHCWIPALSPEFNKVMELPNDQGYSGASLPTSEYPSNHQTRCGEFASHV